MLWNRDIFWDDYHTVKISYRYNLTYMFKKCFTAKLISLRLKQYFFIYAFQVTFLHWNYIYIFFFFFYIFFTVSDNSGKNGNSSSVIYSLFFCQFSLSMFYI